MNKKCFSITKFKKFLNNYKNLDYNQSHYFKKKNLVWSSSKYKNNYISKSKIKQVELNTKYKVRKLEITKKKFKNYSSIVKDFNNTLNYTKNNFHNKKKKILKKSFLINNKKPIIKNNTNEFSNYFFIDKNYHSINNQQIRDRFYKIKKKLKFILNNK